MPDFSKLSPKFRSRLRGILRKGRAAIRRGWTQGSFYREIDGKDCYCMLGAIGANAMGPNGNTTAADYYQAKRLLEHAVFELTQGHRSDVPNYNDINCKTNKDAIRAFDRAIQLAT